MGDNAIAAGQMLGLRIGVSNHLAGSKVAFQFGNGPVFVSPAMYDLIRNANADEMETLLRSIRIVKLPPVPDFRAPQTAFWQPGPTRS